MLKNYLKLGFRNIVKNRLSSIINISGLALAAGCCLVVFVFLDWCLNQDDFHTKRNKIFVLERIETSNGDQQLWGNSPAPMGPMLKNEFPQIKNVTRLYSVPAVIKLGDNVFRENLSFADSGFHQMFDFPVKWGRLADLDAADAIVLTEELSEKLFGKANAVGKQVAARFSANGRESFINFTVKAVFKKQPAGASFYFSALIPSAKAASLGSNLTDDWSRLVNITFLEATAADAVLPAAAQLKKYVALYNAANKNAPVSAFHFQPLQNMNRHSYKVAESSFYAVHIVGIISLLAIAIAIMLLVCFNYMNIAIAGASGRLKEIGVRKAMGSRKSQLIFQFLFENLVTCVFGVLLGVLLAKTIFVPWFSQIAFVDLSGKFFTNIRLWIAMLVLTLIMVAGGAAYPAFYLSSLKPAGIVKGSLRPGSRNRFRKALLGIQFFLTFLGLSMALAFVQENKLSRQRSWGYEPKDNVVVALDETANYRLFASELKRSSGINAVTGSVQPLGRWSKQLRIKVDGQDEAVQSIEALPQFASQMKIPLLAGRDLSDSIETDKTAAVLVNQAFLKKMNWQSGLGKTIMYNNRKYTIVGETADFRFEEFIHKMAPLVIVGCQPEQVKFVYAKTASSLFKTAHASVEAGWKKTFPDLPFNYYYQEAAFDGYFAGIRQASQVMTATCLIMIVVSVSGIFGLALLVLNSKMKEIAVRKVLGAGTRNISFQVVKEFLMATVIAFALGLPVSWLATQSIFEQLSPESKVGLLPLAGAFLCLITMTIFSMLWHLYKANTASPSVYLRNE